MDDRSSKAVSGDFEAKKRGDKRVTAELSVEKTQVVWRARARGNGRVRRKSIIPIVAGTTVVIASLAITLALLMLKSTPPAPDPLNNEDPLALYQVASELHEQGEYRAALQMLQRAREVTKHARAHKQLDELEKLIRDAIAGRLPARPREDKKTEAEKERLKRLLAQAQRVTAERAQRREAAEAGQANHGSKAAAHGAKPRAPQATMVYVQSDAVGDVLVDGRPTGIRTPATLSLEPGNHTIEVVPLIDPSERMSRTISVKQGHSTRVRLSLSAAEEAATVAADPPPAADAGPPATQVPAPAIGTVGAQKPAIGLVGGSKPTIGIVKGDE